MYGKGEGNGTPLQYSCLENPMDGGAWWAAVHGVTKSRTQLSDFTFTFHFHALEKEMATHSSVLALRIPGTREPDGLPSMGSHRVGHDWSDLAAAAAACMVKRYPFYICTIWLLLLNCFLSFILFIVLFLRFTQNYILQRFNILFTINFENHNVISKRKNSLFLSVLR